MGVPLVCVREVEEVLAKEVRRINQDVLRDFKLEMRLNKACYRS